MGKNDNDDNDLLDEIDDLKEKIEGLQTEINDLKEDKERLVGDFEDKLDAEKNKIIEEWKTKLKNLDRDCREKTEAILAELDSMRQAFSGDPGGWELKTTKNGMEYYENNDTGEIREEEPECLYIARAMKRYHLYYLIIVII
jgi:chromosome segregation ATPase